MADIYELTKENYPEFTEDEFDYLEIKLSLRTPVILGFPFIHFDGLIAHLLARLWLEQKYYTLPSKNPMPIIDNLPMPISSITYQNKQLFRASASHFDVNPEEFAQLTTIYKRFEESQVDKLATKKKKVRIDAGLYKNYSFQIPYLPATECLFYCYGHKEAITQLLIHLPGLGKKVLYGYGTIGEINIKKISQDHSFIKNDLAMRSLPVDFLTFASERINLTWAPPYWDKRNIALCSPPGAKISLKSKYRND
ncbi:MAG: hypothetical protein ACTSO3_13820 [Candidatus Heimdallarchaeaceae archaeon]